MSNLRQKNRLKKRDALVEAAFRLFEAHGFDATPVDRIAQEAEVSRRTFFRYFSCKEAVVFPEAEARLEAFRADLQAPVGSPVDRVRHACLEMAAHFAGRREEMLRQHRLVASTPALMVFDLELDRGWEAAIGQVLQNGARTDAARRRAAVWAGAIMGAVRATLRVWYAQDARGDLVRIGAEALDHLEMGMVEAMPKRVVGVR